MGYNDKSAIDSVLSNCTTIDEAIEWMEVGIAFQADIVRDNLNPYSEGTLGSQLWDMGYNDKSAIDSVLPHCTTITEAVDRMESKQRSLIEQALLPPNPFPDGSLAHQLWEMGYHDKELIDDSLARNSSLEGALCWIEEKQDKCDRKRKFHCLVVGKEFDAQDLYIFDW
jgi:hypothetical protein